MQVQVPFRSGCRSKRNPFCADEAQVTTRLPCRVPMQWNDGDVWCAGVQVDEDACALEYKYVIVDNNGHISSWKPGGNYEIKLERYSGAVAVRDDWNGDVHEIRLEPSAQSALPQVPPSAAASMASEDDAVLDALQRAYLELEAALQISLQLADEADDPSDPRLLLNDQKLAAASRRAVSLSKALEAGAPPPAYILKELERGSDPH